jgi:branched-chain amino acid transport system substrate-binding protein
VVEAVRKAQEKYGKGKVMTGEQVRWGFENLNVDEARLKALGAVRHDAAGEDQLPGPRGLGRRQVQRWDGKAWKAVTPNWVVRRQGHDPQDAGGIGRQVRAEKKITPRDCSKEG